MSGEWESCLPGERMGCTGLVLTFPARERVTHAGSTTELLVRMLACSGVPIIGMSALMGRGAAQLLPAALTMYERWNMRVPTSKLNRWVEKASGEGLPFRLLATAVRGACHSMPVHVGEHAFPWATTVSDAQLDPRPCSLF